MNMEQQLKIQEFKSMLNPTYGVVFFTACQSLLFFDELMKEHNISFDDITFEMIFNGFKKLQAL